MKSPEQKSVDALNQTVKCAWILAFALAFDSLGGLTGELTSAHPDATSVIAWAVCVGVWGWSLVLAWRARIYTFKLEES